MHAVTSVGAILMKIVLYVKLFILFLELIHLFLIPYRYSHLYSGKNLRVHSQICACSTSVGAILMRIVL